MKDIIMKDKLGNDLVKGDNVAVVGVRDWGGCFGTMTGEESDSHCVFEILFDPQPRTGKVYTIPSHIIKIPPDINTLEGMKLFVALLGEPNG